MNKKIIFLVFGIIFILLSFSFYFSIDNFTINMKNIREIEEAYETIDLTKIPEKKSLDELLSNPSFIKCKTPIIYYKNGGSGFGSQLTLFTQFIECISKSIPNDSNAICIPWFAFNSNGFKYAEPGVMNSFFLYFKAINHNELSERIKNIENIFVFNNPNPIDSCTPFVKTNVPLMAIPQNKAQIMSFRNHFKLKIGNDIRNEMKNIKIRPLIGVHLRSDAQKIAHEMEYLQKGTAMQRFSNLKKTLDEKYKTGYSVFIATDTNLYLKNAKEIVKDNLYFIDNITRAEGEVDSMPSIEKGGYELGCNILSDCLALSLCDEIYISPSNIMYIVCYIGDDPNINIIEF